MEINDFVALQIYDNCCLSDPLITASLDVFFLWNCYIQNIFIFWNISFGIMTSCFLEIYHIHEKRTFSNSDTYPNHILIYFRALCDDMLYVCRYIIVLCVCTIFVAKGTFPWALRSSYLSEHMLPKLLSSFFVITTYSRFTHIMHIGTNTKYYKLWLKKNH